MNIAARLACLCLLSLVACSGSPELDDGRTAAPESSEASPELAALTRAQLTELALQHGDDPASDLRAQIVARLRADGPAGLDALIADYQAGAGERSTAEDLAWRRLIDEVARQRDAVYGGLFWYTDMPTALAVAAVSGKPVLSLRMLGDLGSEYSCANSRMFRTILYADPQLAAWLEQSFVLHWSSERPVPKLEIDFGDGRVVTRTITGNSAHFVLDARGRTIDVLPGLWSADRFREALGESLALHDELADIRGARQWRAKLAQHHEAAFERSLAQLGDALARLRGEPQDRDQLRAWLAVAPGTGAAVPAQQAVPMAVAKAKIERPILAAGQLGALRGAERVQPGPRDDGEREQLGAQLFGEVGLHANTLAIIAGERPLDGLVAEAEQAQAYQALFEGLRSSVAQDTVKNALELHPRVHAELAARARGEASPGRHGSADPRAARAGGGGDARDKASPGRHGSADPSAARGGGGGAARASASLGFADVDAWVYAQLFETPAEDPWLGLVDARVYTGLERSGLATR